MGLSVVETREVGNPNVTACITVSSIAHQYATKQLSGTGRTLLDSEVNLPRPAETTRGYLIANANDMLMHCVN